MNVPVYGKNYLDMGAFQQVLKVRADSPASMQVRVNAGYCWVNSKLCEYSGGAVTIAASTAGTMVAVVGLRNTQLVVLYGDASSTNNPNLPASFPSDFIPLAGVVVNSTTTAIYDDQIQDLRPFFCVTRMIESHSDLTDTSAEDAHPISAITGLEDKLAEKLTLSDVNTRLEDVSTREGTTNTSFTINKNASGINSTNLVLEFKRGTQFSAGIRWNEELDQMEYTDSLGNWVPFDPSQVKDPFNQDELLWKSDWAREKASLESQIKTKANKSVVDDIQQQINGFATEDFVLSQLNGIYSKQQMDSLVAQVERATQTVNGKVDEADVYTKSEIDEKVNTINTSIDNQATATDTKIANAVAQAKIDLEPKFTEIKNNVTTAINNATVTFSNLQSTIEESVDAKLEAAQEKINQAEASAQEAYQNAQNTIAQNNATAIATASKLVGEQKAAFDHEVERLESIHSTFETVINQIGADFAELKGNTDTSVEELEGKVSTNTDNITALQENKADKADSYTKEEVYTKDEVYTKEETDTNIDEAVSGAITAINASLQEANGIEDVGGNAASTEASLQKIATTFSSVKAKIDEERKTAVEDAYNRAVADTEEDILSKANINSFDEIATTASVSAVDAKVDNKVSELNEKVDSAVEELNTTIDNNQAAAEKAIADVKDELSTTINEIDTAYKDADAALDSTINTKFDELNDYVNEKVGDLATEVEDNKTAMETALADAKTELNANIIAVDEKYEAANTDFQNKYAEDTTLFNTALAAKANIVDTYTKAEVDQKVSEVDYSSEVFTKDEINNMLDNKADIKDVYKYTEAQVNHILETKQLDILGFTPEDVANRNQANGYAGLDANGKISVDLLPDASRQSTYVVVDATQRLALSDLIQGAKAYETSTGDSYIYDGSKWVLIAAANWENINLNWDNINNVPEAILNTYTKTESDDKFAPIVHTHDATDIITDDAHMFMTAEQARALAGKADLSAVYTQDAANSVFVKKADFDTLINTYTNTEGMNNAIATAVAHLATVSSVYTKEDVNSLLADKADKSTFESKVEEINGSISGVQSALEQAVTNANDVLEAKTSELSGDIDEVKDSVESVNTNLTSYVDGKVEEINGSINTAKTELNSDISIVNDRVDALESKLTDEYEKASDIAVDIENAQQAAAEALNAAKTEFNASIEAVQGSVSSVDAKYDEKVSTINSDISALDGRVSAIETSLENDYATKNYADGKVEGAVASINTTLADYAKSDDVTTEINQTVDSAIAGVLTSVNAALTAAKGEEEQGSGSEEVDIAQLVASTASLITEVNAQTDAKIEAVNTTITQTTDTLNQAIEEKSTKAKNDAIAEVRETIVKEVITKEMSVENIGDLASKSYVDGSISTLESSVTGTISEINSDISTINGTISSIVSDITDLQSGKQDALGYTAENVANKNQAGGYAGLDSNGKIKLEAIPDLSLQRTYIVENAVERAGLTGLISGAKAYETSTGNSYIYNGETWLLAAKADWENINLSFNNIVDAPTTIGGYGITNAYTKTEVDNAITSKVNEASATINGTISSVQSALESSIAAGDSVLDGKISTTNSNLSSANVQINGLKDRMTTAENNISSINTALTTFASASSVYTKDEVDGIFVEKDGIVDGINGRVTTLETNIDTKANANAVYSIDVANNTFATKSDVSSVDEKVDDLSNSVDQSIGELQSTVNGNASAISEINGSLSTINASLSSFATTENVNTALQDKISVNRLFNTNGVFETVKSLDNGNFAKLWNEEDGGGSQAYVAASDVIAFAGVNTDTVNVVNDVDQAINVQLYAKYKGNKVGTANYGTRLNINTAGMYYLKGTVKTNSAGREVAVKEDLEAINTALAARITELENTVSSLLTRIEALENA